MQKLTLWHLVSGEYQAMVLGGDDIDEETVLDHVEAELGMSLCVLGSYDLVLNGSEPCTIGEADVWILFGQR